MNAHKLGILGSIILVAAFVLVACWHGNGPAPTLVCGNTYEIKETKREGKEKDFKTYQEIDRAFMMDGTFGLPLSRMSKAFPMGTDASANRGLFENSIAANREDPYDYQKYNYVVCDNEEQDTIWVAIWQDVSTVVLGGISNCPGPKFELENLGTRLGKMINIFPEDKDAKKVSLRGQQSPCWLSSFDTTEQSDNRVEDGLLDAISKHYMIAQRGTPIANFDAVDWSNTQVRYAGEIIVDMITCEYGLNNGSGTYQPEDGEELQEMETLFTESLGVGPAFVFDLGDPDARITLYADNPTQIPVLSGC